MSNVDYALIEAPLIQRLQGRCPEREVIGCSFLFGRASFQANRERKERPSDALQGKNNQGWIPPSLSNSRYVTSESLTFIIFHDYAKLIASLKGTT